MQSSMKRLSKLLVLVMLVVFAGAAFAACGASSDAVTGTWKQTDAVNGDWTWTFGGGKCKLVGDTTGFEGNGTYVLDEKAGTLTVTIEEWDSPTEYTYTLNGNSLKLESTYSSYDLVKQ